MQTDEQVDGEGHVMPGMPGNGLLRSKKERLCKSLRASGGQVQYG